MIKEKFKYPKVSDSIVKEHGISKDEYIKIKKTLDREPTFVELGIYSVMWSEHCSYKSSIKMLKTLPRSGDKLLVDAGEENAGLVDLGDGLATSFKIESHNHPSAVEPYEGAATGVGGIMRDVFTMGARPIASLNSLRFGSLDVPRNRFLLEHVVEGIADYGNCLGIPTVGGEVVIEDSYSGNPLVNAMTVGIMNSKDLISAIAEGAGNPVFIVGSSTGRDGIHGATFASEELTEETESKKSNVQVGDPFTEKLLLEASLELAGKDWLVGMQDMGAAGITCSCSEMSAKGKSGIKINLDLVPLREKHMNAYEIMLSESQERMLVVVKKGNEQKLKDIFNKWELDCTEVGVVTETGNLEVFHQQELVANIPTESLVLGGDAPQYDMPYKVPLYLNEINIYNIDKYKLLNDLNSNLLELLSNPNIASKSYVYNQYDSTVRTNTVLGPGSDSAVIRIKNTKKGLSVSTDCNGKYVYLNPRQGAMMAVAEAARNVVCTGAKPLAITNCLNFGNPQDPEIYWQFREAVLGIGDMCRILNTPVTGGNVSFYNETVHSAVYPTPVIGMVGFIEDISNYMTMDFKNEGDLIVAIGNINPSLGGSTYLKQFYDRVEGPLSNFNTVDEVNVQNLCFDLINQKIINSAHDVSDGGISVALAESVIFSKNNLGAEINIEHKMRIDELLFGECSSLILVSLNEAKLYDLVHLSKEHDVRTQTIGKVVNNGKFIINESVNITKKQLSEVYNTSFSKIMEKVN
ncbi:MAG: phosphoribosylformylglycinamidine synthase II [Candidatus Marinimicrobia bacterium]|nr:phosphoribosylformylglycinamidine synthase II [Candidatus Neomarinimicrobiota bacterium]